MTEMNEPKRRGRPRKEDATFKVDARDESHFQNRADLTEEAMSGVTGEDFDRPPFVHAPSDEFLRRKAQNYANRVWAGQSLSLNRAERLARVQAALEAQGLSMEGVTL